MKLFGKPSLSLLEIVISFVIIVAGLFGMAPLLGIQIFGVDLSGEMRQANEMAQSELENLMQLTGWSELPYLSVSDSVSGIYMLSRRIDDATSDSTIPAGQIKFSVSLAWSDQQRVDRTVSYTVFRHDERRVIFGVKRDSGENGRNNSRLRYNSRDSVDKVYHNEV